MATQSQVIETILEQIEKMSVLELSALVKGVQDKFGVSAAMAMPIGMAGAAAGEAAKVEEKTEFKVTLKNAGNEKIKVIKALREVTQFDLKKAKDVVDSAPSVIVETAPKVDAEKIKEKLEAAGATVELS